MMPRWRVVLVLLVAAFIVVGHAYDMYRMREHWPFSFYPMYGRTQTRSTLQMLGLYGVIPDPKSPKRQTKLIRMTESEYVPPLTEVRIRNILMAAWGRDGSGLKAEKNVTQILKDYLDAYELRRERGLHRGPRLLEAQMCRITYRVKQGATSRKPRSIDPLIGVRYTGQVVRYPAADEPRDAATTKPAGTRAATGPSPAEDESDPDDLSPEPLDAPRD